jgi:hypothetical protein
MGVYLQRIIQPKLLATWPPLCTSRKPIKVHVLFPYFSSRSLMRNLLIFASSLLPVIAYSARGTESESAFNPYAFHQQVATCPGFNRAENKTVDLHLRTLPQSHFTRPLI